MSAKLLNTQKYPIDSEWFFARLKQRSASMRALARSLELDASAVSRMLNGARQMSAEEQDKIAVFLGVDRNEVAAHRGAGFPGFEEMAQAEFEQANKHPPGKSRLLGSMKGTTITPEANAASKKPYRHPAWGALAGMITLLPDVDLTEPSDPDWGKLDDD
jgi:transcriptional regulator with XRE-family HTH domain